MKIAKNRRAARALMRACHMARKVWFGVAVFVLCLGPHVASAQVVLGRTILYDDGDGQIYIAKSGNVYRSYRARARGVQYKIGRTLKIGQPGCRTLLTASLAGTTLTLHQDMTCPNYSMTSIEHTVVIIDGDNCQLTERIVVHSLQGNTAFTEPGANCHIISGNHLAQ